MEIKKEVIIILTTEDVEKILIDHLKGKGIKVESVYFDINGHNGKNDYRAEFPLEYRLDKITCKGAVIET